jgi:PhzF family phenazine biosynthesis protein
MLSVVREFPVFHVDAFTPKPFGGNPAGVVLHAERLSDEEMLHVARDLRHSETAFVLPPRKDGDYRVRFFTPAQEVDLCGHATVATAWVLAGEGKAALHGAAAKQETSVGVFDIGIERKDGALERITMVQAPPRVEAVEVPPGVIAEVLGLDPAHIAVSIGPLQRAYTGNWHLMVPVWTRAAIDFSDPDLNALAELNRRAGCVTTHLWCAGDIAAKGPIYTRDFAPAVGIAEDPVTGTTNGALGGYLVLNGILKGEAAFTVHQGHAIGRPGELRVEATAQQVRIAGAAFVLSRGTLRLP